MTKKVRVENADNRVEAQTWMKGCDGVPDAMQGSKILTNPTDLDDFLITSHQYLVVKEAE